MTIQCCVCRKVKDEDIWEQPGIWIARPVSHTYCPKCHHQALLKLQQSRPANRLEAPLLNETTGE